jgi:V8-like Glu-specific endopeptidase
MMDETVVLVEDGHTYCAGVYISPTEILTAGHCLTGRGWVTYYNHHDFVAGNFNGGHLGIVVKVASSDLGLIKSVVGRHGYAEILSGEVVSGMEGHIIGHPSHQVYTYMRGWVSAIRQNSGVYYFQVQAPVFFGNSGGGIFDSRGRLFGIASALSLSAPNVGYFVSHREIWEFLQEGF